MRIEGDPKFFSVEWEVEEVIDNIIYGHLCFLIGGTRVGNYSEITTLTVVLSYLKDFLSKKGKRHCLDLPSMTDTFLFNEFYDRFFSSSKERSDVFDMGLFRDIYWFDEIAEYSFRDKVGMIVLEDPALNQVRLVWKYFKTGALASYTLSEVFFYSVLEQFRDRLEESSRATFANRV